MLASITPLGERGRGASWRRTVVFYVVASTAGGAVAGAVLGALGSVMVGGLPAWLLAAAGAVALAAAALDVSGRLPAIHRQVDETWLTRYRDWVYGTGFGFQLGLGAVTIATSASLYLTWVVELLLAAPVPSAVAGAVFGVARALPLVGTARVIDAESLRRAHRRWQARLPAARWATVAVQALGGLVLVVHAS